MKTEYNTKQIGNDDIKNNDDMVTKSAKADNNPTPSTKKKAKYSFPEDGRVIEADSYAEALKIYNSDKK